MEDLCIDFSRELQKYSHVLTCYTLQTKAQDT